MNRDAMLAPFADEELHTFKGRGNQDMTYIEDETVMDRLDLGYGPGNWRIEVENVIGVDGAVRVRLSVRSHGEWNWYEDFGYPNREGGESLKEAVSDGIRRCGRFVGIARDLYRKAPDERRTDYNRQTGGAATDMAQAASSVVHAEGGLIGMASLGTTAPVDGQTRQTPDGMSVGFVIGEGREKVQVVAYGPRAEPFAVLMPTEIIGKRVQVFGPVSPETMKVRGRDITFNRVTAERIVTPDATFEFPAEAPSAELFTGPEFEKGSAA